MADNKINLKLDESNNLQFALSIKGSSSEPASNNPNIRFCITEKKSGFACSFPVEKTGEGIVSVTVPEMVNLFKEGIDYEGKLEIFVGNRYFTPTVVDIVFDKNIQIEAALLKQESKKIEDNSLVEIESVIKQQPPQNKTLTMDQKILKKAIFSTAKPLPTPTSGKQVKVVVSEDLVNNKKINHDENDPLVAYKLKLKNIIAGAIKKT